MIGPNGAGKTTLFNLVTGVYQPDGGDIRFEGRSLLGLEPHEITARGIARTFQTLRLFLNLTVKENVMTAAWSHTGAGIFRSILRTPGMRREEKEIERLAEERLSFFGQRLMGYRWNQPAYPLSTRTAAGSRLPGRRNARPAAPGRAATPPPGQSRAGGGSRTRASTPGAVPPVPPVELAEEAEALLGQRLDLALLAPHAGRAQDRAHDAGLRVRVRGGHHVLLDRHVQEEPQRLERPCDPAPGDLVRLEAEQALAGERMSPASGAYTPVTRLNSVVLPAPFGPITLRISCSSTCRSSALMHAQAAEALRDAAAARAGARPSGDLHPRARRRAPAAGRS